MALSAALIAPAAASAKTGSIFDFTRAEGFDRVAFKADPATCEQFGTCGYSGTVKYSVTGKPRGTLVLARSRTGRITGGATYRTEGTTSASVTGPADTPRCSDVVSRKTDLFSAASLPHSIKTLLLSYDTPGYDFLATKCAGPTKKQVAAAGALPEGTFQAAGFRNKRVKWGMSGGQPFTVGGYSATSTWKLSFKAAGRFCNPHCAIPAHKPR